MNNEEQWRYITDLSVPDVDPNRYKVSNIGNIYDTKNEKFLSQPIDSHNYKRAHIHTKYGFKLTYVHRLVKIEFDGYDPDPDKWQVDHKNGDKHKNHLSNLEWVYPHENTHRAINNNLCKHINNVIDEDDARFICEQLKLGKSYGEISDMLFPKTNTDLRFVIGDIYRGSTWKHISKDYIPFPDELDKSYYLDKRPLISSRGILTEEIVHEICRRLEDGERSMDIAIDIENKYNIDRSLEDIVGGIRQGRNYLNISSKYNIPKGSNSRKDKNMDNKKLKNNAEVLSEFEDSIRNYGDKIEHIDNFIDAVRRFPGMYIGARGNIGWKACIREIFQNAVDEMIRKESPCRYVKITFDERYQSAIIEDTGRGIPHGKIIEIYASSHTSSNYSKKAFEYTSGVHGVGSGVAMALSKVFEINSFVLGEARSVRFESGIPTTDNEVVIKCPNGRQGTTVTMMPDLSVLDDVSLVCEDILDLVLKVYPLVNIGDRIDFIGIDSTGKVKYSEELVNKDGIISSLMIRTQTPLVAPIYYKDDTGYMKAEVAFTYDSSDLTSAEDIVSYANFTPTTGGTHIAGFMDGLCNFLRNYMNKIYLGEKSKISVINNDIKTGLKVIIAAAHLNPVFAGQFKGILSNEDMYKYVKDLTTKSLEEWSKTSPGSLQKICKCIKEIAEIRMKSDDSKIKLSNNYESSALTGKPKKYVPPSGNKNLELVIVEGDSALGSAKNSRDVTRQGIFPEMNGAIISNDYMQNLFNCWKAKLEIAC